jgi:nucleoid-associated protein YgaU
VLLVVLILLAVAFIASQKAAPDQQQPPPAGTAQSRQQPTPAAPIQSRQQTLPVGTAQNRQQPTPAATVQSRQQTLPAGAAVVWDPPQTAADGTVSLSGSTESGSTVELWAGEIKLAAVPVDAEGNWSYAGQLDPGDYQIVARTVSVEGQVLNESEAVSVSVTRAAAVTVNEPQVDASGEPILSGTGEPGSTVEILDNGVVVASAVVGEDGAWTVRYTASAGEHALTVRVQGQAGESSAVARVAVTGTAPVGGQSYVVRNGDWLIKLARRYYGDPGRWIDIYEATNAKAVQDPSYHEIGNPNWLSPGWKLWIPEP